MDFVFQSGEFYYENAHTWYDAFVDVFLPILTLIIGFALPIGYSYFKDRKRIKDKRSRLLFEIGALQKPLNEQIEAIDKMLDVIRSGSSTKFGLTMIENLLNVDARFAQYSTDDLLKVFKGSVDEIGQPSDHKQVHNLQVTVALISRIADLARSEHVERIKKFNAQKPRVNELIGQIQRTFQGYSNLVKEKKLPANDPYVVGCVEIFNSHMEVAHEESLYFGKESLIDPLIEFVGVHAPNNLLAQGILPFLYECNSLYKAMETEMIAVVTVYDGYARALENAGKTLEKVQGSLEGIVR